MVTSKNKMAATVSVEVSTWFPLLGSLFPQLGVAVVQPSVLLATTGKKAQIPTKQRKICEKRSCTHNACRAKDPANEDHFALLKTYHSPQALASSTGRSKPTHAKGRKPLYSILFPMSMLVVAAFMTAASSVASLIEASWHPRAMASSW